MWPLICDGDEVQLEFLESPVSIHSCHPGDVVLHRDRNEWVLHRVIDVKGRMVFKGDFSNSYFFTEDEVVWAKAPSVLSNRLLAKLSSRVMSQTGASRKLIKFLIYLFGKVLRLSFSRQYLKF